MITDPISDLLTRIRNANLIYKEEAVIPYSKIKWDIAIQLKEEGFLTDVSVFQDGSHKMIRAALKYAPGKKRVISGLVRVSHIGCRVYSPVRELWRYKKGLGLTILSTPKGVMTDKRARQLKVGGEVLCSVW
jgi:small subunit ribosomal protein S8